MLDLWLRGCWVALSILKCLSNMVQYTANNWSNVLLIPFCIKISKCISKLSWTFKTEVKSSHHSRLLMTVGFWHLFSLSFSFPLSISFCLFVFQVDMLVPTKITGIITQGAKDFGHVQFVGSYKLAFSNDGERWHIYQDEKQKKDKVKLCHAYKWRLTFYIKAKRYLGCFLFCFFA